MKLLSVLTQYGTRSLDRAFSYTYSGNKRVEERFRVLIDFNGKNIVGFVMKVSDTNSSIEELEEINGYKIKEIVDVIDVEPLLNDSLMELATEVSSYYMAPLISVLQAMLPKTLSPKLSSLKGPKIAYEKWVELLRNDETDLTPKQIEMLRLIASSGPVLKKDLGSPTVLNKLIERNLVRLVSKERRRFQIPEEEIEKGHEMTVEQRNAYDYILSTNKKVILLQGVTGSGKTEVYLRLSEKILNNGKTVLMLVPEINLTPAMVEYFIRRFGPKVAVIHSELSPGEKYDEYRRIAKGEAKIVVGARSAVFAPLSNIGLIILDEEHVESYKQENSPYYHARNVAIMRGEKEGCKVILGSATPSLETKARANKGIYGFASLPHRVNEKALPNTSIIDLRDRKNYTKKSEKLSRQLLEAIKNNLGNGEQTLLLINRRGYWTTIICPQCGHIFKCPCCGGSLTYHKEDQMLKCHHCGFVDHYPHECPECHSKNLSRTGYGTERIEKELNDIFPGIRVARLDSDVTKVSTKMDKVLKEFHDGKYDVLVGTEMIAKGHDFPNVTLACVVLADIGLNMPTFRASERTFQLIAQTVGRSGRSHKTGVAMIQTYNPDHYSIALGAKQDYEQFYLREMQQRRAAQYPPYVYMFVLEFSCSNEERLVKVAYEFKDLIKTENFENVSIVGPIIPFYSLINGKYKRVLLIKYKKREGLDLFVKNLVERYNGKSGIEISLDVDPMDY